MRLIKSVTVSLTARFVSIFIALPTSVMLARYLGPSGKGTLAVILAISGIFLQFGNLGIQSANTYFSAKERESIPALASISVWISLIMGTIAAVALVLLIMFADGLFGGIPSSYLLVAVLGLPFVFLSLYMQNILLGIQKIFEYNFIEIFFKGVYLVAIIVLLIWLGGGVFEIIILYTVISVITGLTFLGLIRSYSGINFRFDQRLFSALVRYGAKAYIATFFAFLVIRSDLLLINYYLGTKEAGYYSLAVNFTDWLLLIPMAVAAMLFPKATEIADDKSELARKVSRHLVILMGVICISAFLLARPLILFAYGQAFGASIMPFILLLPGIFFLALEMIYMQDFAARGMPPIVYFVPGVGLILNLALNIAFIPIYGIMAASISSSLSYFLMFVVSFEYFRKLTGSRYGESLLIKRQEIFELISIWRDRFLWPFRI